MQTQGGNTQDGFNFQGIVDVTADGIIRRFRSGSNLDASSQFTTTFVAGSVLNVAGSILDINMDGRWANAPTQAEPFRVLLNGTATVHSGATLNAKFENNRGTIAADVHAIDARMSLSGTLNWAGEVGMKARNTANNRFTINSAGVAVITGNSSTFRELLPLDTDGQGSKVATTIFTNNGTLRGSSASDTLQYNSDADATERLTILNNSILAPSTLGGAGTLSLAGVNVDFAANSSLNLDIGGTTSGTFDVLSLISGSSSDAGNLNIANGAEIKISYISGFAPESTFSITILNYGSHAGSFVFSSITGATGEAANPANYSVTYGANSAVLTVAIPEPANLAFLSLGGSILVLRRRA